MTLELMSGYSLHCSRCQKTGHPYQYAYVWCKETSEALCDAHLVTPRPSQWDKDGNRVYQYESDLKD